MNLPPQRPVFGVWVLMLVCLGGVATAAWQAAGPDYPYQAGHTRDILFVGWTEDSARILSYSAGDGSMRLWDVATGRLIGVLTTSRVKGPTFTSPELGITATRLDDHRLDVRNTRTGALLWSVGPSSPEKAISPDGRLAAERGRYWDPHIAITDTSTGALLRRISGHPGVVYALAYSPDGSLLASANGDYTVTIRDAATGQLRSIVEGHQGPAHAVTFSADGRLLASSSFDGTIRIWKVASLQTISVLEGHFFRTWALAFSPDGHTLASGGEDNVVKLWEVSGGRMRLAIPMRGEQTSGEYTICCGSPLRALAFSPSGRTLASGERNGTFSLWDAVTGDLLGEKKREGQREYSHSIRFNGEASWEWLSGSSESPAVLASADEKLLELRGTEARSSWKVSLSPDGRRIATMDIGGQVTIWDARSGRRMVTVKEGPLFGTLTFSPDGRFLAVGGEDQTIRVWDTATGALAWDAAQVR